MKFYLDQYVDIIDHCLSSIDYKMKLEWTKPLIVK